MSPGPTMWMIGDVSIPTAGLWDRANVERKRRGLPPIRRGGEA